MSSALKPWCGITTPAYAAPFAVTTTRSPRPAWAFSRSARTFGGYSIAPSEGSRSIRPLWAPAERGKRASDDAPWMVRTAREVPLELKWREGLDLGRAVGQIVDRNRSEGSRVLPDSASTP